MSYNINKYNFCPYETMCLDLINKGLKWHRKDKVFEDCYGVFWPEETVFAIINKLLCQKILSNEIQGLHLIKTDAKKLMQPSQSLIDEVTHLSLEGFDEYLKEIWKLGDY